MLYNRYWELVYNTAYKRLNDSGLCKDIVQDLFLDIWERRSSIQIENFPGYINKATKYIVYKIVANQSSNISFYDKFESTINCIVNANDIISDKELKMVAKLWLNALPPKKRAIFILHFQENLSTKEIALKLGISQKTVQNQLGTASNELRDKMIKLLILLATS